MIGAFPWRYEGLEACPCRIVCFMGIDEAVEAVGDVAKAIFDRSRSLSGQVTGDIDRR